MNREKIVLIGGGGHCNSVIDVIEEENKYEILGIIDKKELIGNQVLGYDIIACDDDLENIFGSCKNAVICIGHIESYLIREKLYKNLKEIGFKLPVIISPFSYVSKHSVIGEGTVVMHHSLINANSKIGKCCIINSKALIEHDSIVNDFCHVSTAAVINGGVKLKKGTFFGSNSTSKQSIDIEGFIKAGSVVK